MKTSNRAEASRKPSSGRIGPGLYWRGGKIVARVRVNGKPTWRSTGTDNPTDARQWLKKWRQDDWLMAHGFEPKGVVLQRKRVTVQQVVDAYLKAGCPTRKMQPKSPVTVKNEKYFLNPVLAYFGAFPAASLTLADCDKYRDWRANGGYVAKFTVRGKPQTMKTRGGDRAVDLELVVLSNALHLGVRRNMLSANPIAGRNRYTVASGIRHCREVAPSPVGLGKIERWLRDREENGVADLVCFLAYSGLRIGEALAMEWEMVDWSDSILHVAREKKGITPWVAILSEMEELLRDMQKRATSFLLFPSPFDPKKRLDSSAIRRRLAAACVALQIGHVTPHGLRSYFVTSARESGLSDAEIASLIGDKTGPAIIAQTYGDVRDERLRAQARKISLVAKSSSAIDANTERSIKCSITSPDVAPNCTPALDAVESAKATGLTGDQATC